MTAEGCLELGWVERRRGTPPHRREKSLEKVRARGDHEHIVLCFPLAFGHPEPRGNHKARENERGTRGPLASEGAQGAATLWSCTLLQVCLIFSRSLRDVPGGLQVIELPESE